MKSKEERKKDKQKKQNKWQMNRELYLCSLLMLAVFAGMIWYLADYVSSNQEALFNNSYNSQQRVLAQENTRGTIYAGTGEVLAQTVIAEDGTSVREYPYKNIFAHVVGYTDKGKTGIEELENYQLIHSDISDREKLDHELAGEKNPGNDVYTTLDTSLQQAASDALGLYRGAIVVTEVKTGRVLAMVSKPDYDPNKIAENWETLSTDKDKAALVNRGTQGLYPPGSTFKIVTALAYIRQNPDSWQNYHYQCNGAYINGDNKINCYHGSVHGDVNLMTSFAKSCNASFANIGMSMDREKFGETIDGLLFNQEFSFPLPYNQTKVTLDQDSTDEDVIQTSIGQGKTQITPVQLNLITAAIANGGTYTKPVFYTKILDQNGDVVLENKPQTTKVFRESTAYLLTSALESVVNDEGGTGNGLQLDNMPVAGKTGTTSATRDVWFAGFTPYYTCAVWAGYDTNEFLEDDCKSFHKTLWKKVMSRIHEDLPYVDFEMPSTVKEATICTSSGLLAGSGCPTRTEYFETSTIPTVRCTRHYVAPTPSPWHSHETDPSDSDEDADTDTDGTDTDGTDTDGDGIDTVPGNDSTVPAAPDDTAPVPDTPATPDTASVQDSSAG